MKNVISRLFGILLVVVGAWLFLSPEIMEVVNKAEVAVSVMAYDTEHEEGRTEDESPDGSEDDIKETEDEEDAGGGISKNAKLLNEIMTYNVSLYTGGQTAFLDPFFYEASDISLERLTDDEVFGYIEIPSIDQKLKLYLGATSSHLDQGAAVMGETSIPVGGTNTNSVIAGHRGWRSWKYFKDIEEISEGDYVIITEPWDTLYYKVCEIKIIDPDDTDAIKIQEGRDLVTLLTCHPYMSGGKYRYLVICERCDAPEDNASETAEVNETEALKSTHEVTVAAEDYTYVSSSDDITKENLFRYLMFAIIVIFTAVCLIRNRHK